MSFPTVVSITSQRNGDGFSSGGTSHNIALPEYEVGDLVVLFLSSRQTVSSTPAGWTVLESSAYHYHTIIAKIMDGTEGSSVTFTMSAAGNSTTHKYLIRDFTGFPESDGSTTGDPPELSPSWGAADTLWIAMINNNGGSNRISTGAPTDYSNHLCTYASNTFTVDMVVATADRELNAATENPGAFASSQANKAATVAIQGIATVGTDHVQDLSATITMSANMSRSISRTLTDTVTLTASIMRNISRRLTESIAMTAVIRRTVARTLVETVTMGASIIKGVSRTLLVNISLSATISRGFGRFLTASITMSASMSRSMARTLRETITMTATFIDNVVLGIRRVNKTVLTTAKKNVVMRTIKDNVIHLRSKIKGDSHLKSKDK